MTVKEKRKQRAINWADSDDLLSIYLCTQIFNKSDSCIRKWIKKGKLSVLKEGEENGKGPVKVLLSSVIELIDSFMEG